MQVALASSPVVAVLHIVGAAVPKIAAQCAAARGSLAAFSRFWGWGYACPPARGMPNEMQRCTLCCRVPSTPAQCGIAAAQRRAAQRSSKRSDAMPTGIPCRRGYRADGDTVPTGIPCRQGYHAR